MSEAVHPFPSPEHPVLGCARAVTELVASARAHDPVFMEEADKAAALVALLSARDQVAALLLRVMAASEDMAQASGARDVAAWLAHAARIDRPVAGALQRLAHDLESWHVVAAGVASGVVNLDQARVITRCLTSLRDDTDAAVAPDVLALAEARLVELAAAHPPRELARLGERILTLVAPEVGEARDRRALEAAERRASAATRLTMRRRGDGSTDLHARIPDGVASRLTTLLDAFTSPRTQAGPATHLDPATGARVPRERLLGGAFCALLEAIPADAVPLHGGSATTVVVTLDLATLRTGLGTATTSDGTTITAGEARRLACTAGIVPMVLGGRSQPLDLGRARRLASKPQRLVLAHEHPTCRADRCGVPATWCEAHHWRNPWSKGGKTDLADLALLCPWHHHRAHDPRYTTSRGPDGTFTFHRRT